MGTTVSDKKITSKNWWTYAHVYIYLHNHTVPTVHHFPASFTCVVCTVISPSSLCPEYAYIHTSVCAFCPCLHKWERKSSGILLIQSIYLRHLPNTSEKGRYLLTSEVTALTFSAGCALVGCQRNIPRPYNFQQLVHHKAPNKDPGGSCYWLMSHMIILRKWGNILKETVVEKERGQWWLNIAV